jgi:hypothetical protein
MNKSLTVVLAASLLVALASTAQAEQGLPSQGTLRDMGLYGMSVLSDREAMDIRGMGYRGHSKSKAIAFGVSYAKVEKHGAEAGTIDGYYAEGKHFAAGAHGSVAGVIVIKKKGGGHHGGGDWGNDTPAPVSNNGPPHDGGGHHGGGVKVKATIVFAGGFAVSKAY